MPNTLFKDMINAYFDYLGTRPNYTALGLKEFRLINGKELLPVGNGDALGLLSDDLPAHALIDYAVDPRTIADPGRLELKVTLELHLVYAARGDFPASDDVGGAAETLLNEVYQPMFRSSGLNSGGKLTRADIAIQSFQTIRAEGRDMTINYWLCRYKAELYRGFAST